MTFEANKKLDAFIMHDRTQTLAYPSKFTAHRIISQIWLACTAMLISACGGGGDAMTVPNTTPTPQQPPTEPGAAMLQGRWLTSNGITPTRTAIVLTTAAGDTEMWLLSSDLSSLSRLQVSTSGADGVSATGKTYSLPSSTSNPAQSATYSGSVNLSNNTLSLNAEALLLTRSDELTTPTALTDVVGGWSASAGGQRVTLQWTIDANGIIGGPSSTGCSYSGILSARRDGNAYNASVTETCSSGIINFAGIATYRANLATLTLVLISTDADQSQGLVLSLNRP